MYLCICTCVHVTSKVEKQNLLSTCTCTCTCSTIHQNDACAACILWTNLACRSVFLISLYGAPLAQRASYLALQSSLFGPVAQVITCMIILSLTALTFVNWLKMYSQWRTH